MLPIKVCLEERKTETVAKQKKDFVKSTVTRLMPGGNRYEKNKDRINAKRRVKYAAKKAPSPH